MGSVFSPFYARARREHGDAATDPLAHSAINVALYGDPADRGTARGAWALTECAPPAVHRASDHFAVSGSTLRWDGAALVVDVDERNAVGGHPLRGRVRLIPRTPTATPVSLDGDGRHQWWPVAPLAEAEVELTSPRLRFRGSAYHDANWGVEPLEACFRRWNWSRAELSNGAAVIYDVEEHGSRRGERGLFFGRDGGIVDIGPTSPRRLPRTRWLLGRQTRGQGRTRVRRTLEDTPFYSRSLLDTTLNGERVVAMHESLDLDRFDSRWVQWMLPYRMRRQEVSHG